MTSWRWWVPPALGGALWTLLCGLVLYALIGQARDENVEPIPLTTVDAFGRLEDDVRQPVALTDVELSCDEMFLYRGKAHAPARSSDRRYIVVVVEPSEEVCDGGAWPSGVLLQPSVEHLVANLGVPDARARNAAVLDSHGVPVALLLGVGVLTVLGALPLVIARRRQQQLEATLDRVRSTAKPQDPSTSAPVDPMLGRPIEIADGYIDSLRRRGRWLAAGRLIAAVVGIGILGGAGWLTLDRHQTWTRGVASSEVDLEIAIESEKLVVAHWTSVTALYEDRDGQVHQGSADNMSMFWRGGVGQVELRYRPGDPSKFVVSTLIDQTPGTLLCALGFASIFLGIAIWGPRIKPEIEPDRLAVLQWGMLTTELDVTSRVRTEPQRDEPAILTYGLRARASGHCFELSIRETDPRPMFFDSGEAVAVGLCNPAAPTEIVVLRSDWSPLKGPHPRIAELQARWRERAGFETA